MRRIHSMQFYEIDFINCIEGLIQEPPKSPIRTASENNRSRGREGGGGGTFNAVRYFLYVSGLQ
jgi:hypothetical protein